MSPRATTRPSCASITNTLRLLCTSSPTYDSIGLPSSLRWGRIATPWLAVDLTAAEGSPPSSIRFWVSTEVQARTDRARVVADTRPRPDRDRALARSDLRSPAPALGHRHAESGRLRG